MKKLSLLTLSLLSLAAVQANIVLETTFKSGQQELVMDPVVLNAERNSVVYCVGERNFKVVLTRDEDVQENSVVSFDVFALQADAEILIAQPEFTQPELTLSNGEESIIFVVNHVQDVVEEVQSVEVQDVAVEQDVEVNNVEAAQDIVEEQIAAE